MRAGLKLAAARGVTAVHDKDGWLGALRLWQRLEQAGLLTLRVWQSVPAAQVGCARGARRSRSGLGGPLLRLGYLKVFMDGTLGSETALLLDGSGVRITSGEELAAIVLAGRAPGFPVAVHAIGDGANREALDAFERTRDGLGAARPAPPGRARAAARARGPAAASPSSASPARSSSRTRPPTATSPTGSGRGRPAGAYAYRSLVESGAVVANGSDAPIEELDPLAGIRAGVRRTIDERAAWHPEQALTVEQAFEATTLGAGLALRATSAGAGSCSRATPPTSSCSTATRGDDLDAEVVATMVAGRWVHNPPPWD